MSLDLAQSAARMFTVGFVGKNITPDLRELLQRGVGGVILFARNVGTPADVAALVSAMGTRLLQGIQSAGIAASGKHFPGHGDTTSDSHLDLPRLPHPIERLEQVELPPFQAAVQAGVASIMTAHVIFAPIDPQYP